MDGFIFFSTVQMSLRGGALLFPTKQSPVSRGISIPKEVASPPKNKIGGSQRHQFIKCSVESFIHQLIFYGNKRRNCLHSDKHAVHPEFGLWNIDYSVFVPEHVPVPIDDHHLFSDQFPVWDACAGLWDDLLKSNSSAQRIWPPNGVDRDHGWGIYFAVRDLHGHCGRGFFYFCPKLNPHAAVHSKF